MCGSTGRVELGDSSRPLIHAGRVLPALDALGEKHLHPDADSQHGPAAREAPFDGFITTAGPQGIHHGAECSDAGHDKSRRLLDEGAIAGQARIGSCRDERLHRGVDIARPVVEDSDQGCVGHRAPLVLGIPSTSGSRALA